MENRILCQSIYNELLKKIEENHNCPTVIPIMENVQNMGLLSEMFQMAMRHYEQLERMQLNRHARLPEYETPPLSSGQEQLEKKYIDSLKNLIALLKALVKKLGV